MVSTLNKNQQLAIRELLHQKINSREDLAMVKRKLAKKYKIGILYNSEILQAYRRQISQKKIKPSLFLEKILRKRAVRTMSGIAPVAVLTKPYPCPGRCAYCPTEKNVPQSYLSNEPAVMRAIRCGYNPYKQVQLRLRSLEANGHQPTKIELIVIGGTWSALPEKYKYWYIKECFKAANRYESRIMNYESRKNAESHNSLFIIHDSIKSLKEKLAKEQKKNESAKYRLIGITLETRPDYINEKELLEMRQLGATRVELGVQALDDKILQLNKRGHGVAEIVQATELLKNFGFKVTYHIMPGLPGSTPAKDLKMFKQLFVDERFQPDQLKFYPTVVTRGSLLYYWWKAGKYKPYSPKVLENLIIACKKIVPPYVRIIRLIRDIPGESIIAGNMITNLRQMIKDRGIACGCIRCREAREKELRIKNYELRGKKELLEILADEINVKQIVFDRKIKNEVELDTKITPELKAEGQLRELTRIIQGLRKETGYTPKDKIYLWLEGQKEIEFAVNKYLNDFKEKVGAESVEFRRTEKSDAELETKIDDQKIWIGIKKIK